MRTATRLSIVALVAAVLLHAGRAWAPYHLVVIDQVFLGTADCPNAQYVTMRLLSAGMAFFNNQHVRTQNADGSPAADFGTFTMAFQNNASGANIIMGTAEAAGLFGIAMDQEVSGRLVVENGRVCFAEWTPGSGNPVDCVAYGDFTGDNGSGGAPAASPPLGMALVRQSDSGDDATAFVVGAPAPRNNANETGTLGTCPGGANTPTPTVTGVPTGTVSGCVGDCNGDGSVGINELILGVNISLGLQPIDACPAFDCQNNGMVGINCLIQGVNNSLSGCPATPTPTPMQGAGPVGVRRFSIDPASSQFIAVIGPGAAFPSYGFHGFLEFTATQQAGGLVFVDLTDASDYLSIDIPIGGTAVCLKILRDQLPIRNAGLLSCDTTLPLGIQVTQDHNIGKVGTCSGGANEGGACSGDDACLGSMCFTADTCAAAGGTVEAPTDPHPGVCNGPLVGVQDTEPSPPGTLVVAPDPNGIIHGIPVELAQESSTPCGDEGITGYPVTIGFTTGRATGRVLSYNNEHGSTLEAPVITGVPVSCEHWQEEDGPGTLVLSAPNLDTLVAGGFADIMAQFVLVD